MEGSRFGMRLHAVRPSIGRTKTNEIAFITAGVTVTMRRSKTKSGIGDFQTEGYVADLGRLRPVGALQGERYMAYGPRNTPPDWFVPRK